MEGVSFEEETRGPSAYGVSSVRQKSFMFRLVLASGMARTDDEAHYVLAGIAIVAGIAAMVIFFVARPHTPPARTPADPHWPKPVVQAY